MTSEKVAATGVRREPGYLYFVDDDGDVARAKAAPEGRERAPVQKVARLGIKKERGYLYFVDQRGDVARARIG